MRRNVRDCLLEPNETAWKESADLTLSEYWETMMPMLSYPARTAARQRSFTDASVKPHSPSERNITTGVLRGYCKCLVFQMRYVLPLRCGMPLHDFSGTDEGIVKVGPSCRVVVQKKLD